jgi:hypothetical protein
MQAILDELDRQAGQRYVSPYNLARVTRPPAMASRPSTGWNARTRNAIPI